MPVTLIGTFKLHFREKVFRKNFKKKAIIARLCNHLTLFSVFKSDLINLF